jgi:hypothetical protein
VPLLQSQGSYQLDANFYEYMRTVLDDDNVFTRWADSYRGDYMQFMSKEWEGTVKVKFGQSSGSKLQVRIGHMQGQAPFRH